MANLLKLRNILIEKKPNYPINYAIPDLFNVNNYTTLAKTNNGEHLINPYDFLIELLDDLFLKDYKKLPTKSLSALKGNKFRKGGDWIKKSVVYSMMIRTSTAWDHDRNGFLDENNIYHLKENGTFIKTLMLLPLLLEMGVDAIYLLPISEFSTKNKKGNLGSPYSVSDFFKLDPNLADPIVEESLTLDEQFELLVEACHLLGIRVLIDIIPRTNATDSELIVNNPEWFYWIKSKDLSVYKPPVVEEIKESTVAPTKEYMKTVYKNKNVLKHLSLFQFDPKTQNKAKWEQLKKEYNNNKEVNILTLIEKHYGLTTAPAFSDHINDNQPPWSDVTFFRLYLDHPKQNKKYLKDKNIPPYVLFDTIKSNLHPGEIPNIELWNTLASVIPHYQKKYGIDGARIDMGHALPKDLVKLIISKAKEVDPDFCFIAEELNPANDKQAKALGYNMIIGNGFMMEWELEHLSMHKFMLNQHKLSLPSFACGETHDTPRLAARDGHHLLSRFLTIMNMFVPNAVPFINSGQEVLETQPMNTGIGARKNELYMLPETDPGYGKLALFDSFAFHYLNPNSHDIKNHLKRIKPIRKKYLKYITNKNAYLPLSYLEGNNLLGFAYKANNEILFILGNPYYTYSQYGKIDLTNIKEKYSLLKEGKLLYATYESKQRDLNEFDPLGNPYFLLGSGEVKVFTIKIKK